MTRRIVEATGDSTEFHDSALLQFTFDPIRDRISIVLELWTRESVRELWLIELESILHFEMDACSIPSDKGRIDAPEIHDVYLSQSSYQYRRWLDRLKALGKESEGGLFHVICASSTLCNWEEDKEGPKGVEVVCRTLTTRRIHDVTPAADVSSEA